MISLRDLPSDEIMNNHWASKYISGNLPNNPDFKFNDEYLFKNYGFKWDKEDKSQLDTVNIMINNKMINNESRIQQPPDVCLKMCKKQIERRGSVGLFYSHRK